MPDNYDIEEEWLELKELIRNFQKIDSDIYSFIHKRNKKASKRLRKNLLKMHKLALSVRKNILYQRKENVSNYEDY